MQNPKLEEIQVNIFLPNNNLVRVCISMLHLSSKINDELIDMVIDISCVNELK